MGACFLATNVVMHVSVIFSVLFAINYLFAEPGYYNISSKTNFTSTEASNSSYKGEIPNNSKNVSSNTDKAVAIIFDRGDKTQFTNAKTILDKYGFKASFFVICSFIDGNFYYKLQDGKEVLHYFDDAMNWNEIQTLDKEGHDIESHGMQHQYLRNLTSEELEYEVGDSKECLEDHGFSPVYFQIPSNRGGENSTILKTISEYFEFGLSGHSRLMFLNCDGWVNHGFKTKSYKYQYDCNPYSDQGIPTRTHKYAIKEWSHDRYHSKINNQYPNLAPHGSEISNMVFSEFVNLVNSQILYNEKAGKIVAIPILGYHNIDIDNTFDTSKELFDREMKYLYDNKFKVLRLTDLGYNEKEHRFYIE